VCFSAYNERTRVYGESAHMANWLMYGELAYDESTMANRHMVKRHMVKYR